MKNIVKLCVLITILAFIFISCRSRFNPRYYYNKSADNSSIDDSGFVDGDGDLDFDDGGGSEFTNDNSYTNNGGSLTNGGSSDGSFTVTTNTVYLDPFNNGDWNDKNYRFSMNFDNYVIQATFDGNNRPTYRLVRGNWYSSNPSRNEYYYDGPNTSGSGQPIYSVKYYLYKSKNPAFATNSRYNKNERMQRFYFYRFTGRALGLVDTDNYLIAIDTYSKLVFAFAVPVQWKQYIAGTPKAPVGWGSADAGWEADYNSGSRVYFKVEGVQYFYEYDPIGIVKENGEIEIYQWCLDSIGNNKRYGPRIDGGNPKDLSRAIATYGQPGRSPYIAIKTNIVVTNGSGGNNGGSSGGGDSSDSGGNDSYVSGDTTIDRVTITAKSFKNINVTTYNYNVYWNYTFKRQTGFFTYNIGGSAYDGNFPTEAETIAQKADVSGIATHESLQKVDTDATINLSGSKSFDLENIKVDKDIYLDLASDIRKYNLNVHWADTIGFGNNGSGQMTSKSTPILRMVYNPDSDMFAVDNKASYYNYPNTMMNYDRNFTLKKGERKDFTITYIWWNGNQPNIGEKVEVTYTLEFKSVK